MRFIPIIVLVSILLMASVWISPDSDASEDVFSLEIYDSESNYPLSETQKPLIRQDITLTFDTDTDVSGTKYRADTSFDLTEGVAYLSSNMSDIGYSLSVSITDPVSLGTSFLSHTGIRMVLSDPQSGVIGTAILEENLNGDGSYISTFKTDGQPTIFSAGVHYTLGIYANKEVWLDSIDIDVEGLSFRFSADAEVLHKVTFDSNGGTPVSEFKTLSVGDEYGELPNTSRSGYSFNGWYTEKTGGTRITSDSIFYSSTDQVLYAHWSYIPAPTPDPKPEPPTPSEPEHSTSESIGDDGSKTETEKETMVDGDKTTVIQKETVTKTDGSTQVTESKTVTEKTEAGSTGTSTSTVTVRDSQGRLVSTTEIITTTTVDGDTKVTITESVTKDPRGKVISMETTETVDTDLGDSRIETTSTTVTETSDGKVTTETFSETSGRGGSTEKVNTVTETHTDPNGNILKVVETESTVTETTVSGSTITKTDSKVTVKDADGNVLRRDTVTSKSSLSVSGKETTASSASTTESRDAEGKLIGITESFSETTQSPGSDIVTEFTERFTSPDGETKVSEGVQNTAGDYSITTVAVVVTEKDRTDANAQTTLNYLGEATLDSEDVDRAYEHSVKTTQNMERHNDMSRDVRVSTGFGVSAKATSGAMERISDLGMGLYIEGSIGSLRYDAESCRGFSDFDKDIAFSLVMDAVDVLTEAQKVVIGSNSFVSVSAYAGAEYVTDLGGTVTISFVFNPGLMEYVACYIADDGSKEEVSFDYDQSTGKVSMRSIHHSVYAMLPVEKPSEEALEPEYLLFILIVVIIAVSAAIIVWRNRA